NYASGEKLGDIVSKDAFPRFKKAVAEKKGEAFYPSPLISLLVGNVIATICFGKKYELDDPEFMRIVHTLDEVNNAFGNGHVADFLPIFRCIPTRGITRLKRAMKEWLQLIQHNIDEQKMEFNKGNTGIKSLIGDILRIQKEAFLAGDEQADQLTDINVRQTVSNMFVAGLDTTINSLDWAIAYLTYYPRVQEKVHQEIDDIIGHNRFPMLADKVSLPYCEAVIREVLRIRTIIPFAVPHATTCNTSVGGYQIPKDSWIWCNLWNVHMDENHWEHPNEFRP
ncbi:cytochrome P450 1A1-like, partial [Saccoglossus kowalevskii]